MPRMKSLFRPAPRWVEEKPTERDSIASVPATPSGLKSAPSRRDHWPGNRLERVSRLLAVTTMSVGSSGARSFAAGDGFWGAVLLEEFAGLGAATRTKLFAPTFLTLRPLPRARRSSAAEASILPRIAGEGRLSRSCWGTAMLMPACLPMANAASPTVPAGTLIGLEAVWPGAAMTRSAPNDAPA